LTSIALLAEITLKMELMSKKRILVAEDEPNEAFFLERMFRETAPELDLAFVADGQEAVAYLQSCGEGPGLQPTPDVLLVDLRMPGLDGFGVLEWVRSRGTHRHMLRVVLTGSEDPRDLHRAYQLGANAYLKKPFTKDQLQTLTRMLMADGTRVTSPAAA
jgi:CheY-like chemotaxis protein